jgi:hypothetical protein
MVVCAPLACAHESSESFVAIEIDKTRVEIVAQASPRDVARLAQGQHFADHAGQSIKVRVDQGPCPQIGIEPLGLSGGNLERARLVYQCPDRDGLEIQVTLFSALIASHVTLATARIDGQDPIQFAFGAGLDIWRMPTMASEATHTRSLMRYLTLGFEHIFLGFDHGLFLLGLVAIFGLTRSLILAITGFTLGHSISLALVSLGVVHLPSYVTESLIGLTILLIALDGMIALHAPVLVAALAGAIPALVLMIASILGFGHFQPAYFLCLALAVMSYTGLAAEPKLRAGIRPIATLVFGLIHGSGLASGLIETGLPQGQLFGSILAFNIGVELGQVALAIIGAGLLLALGRYSGPRGAITLSIFTTAAFGSAQFIYRAMA